MLCGLLHTFSDSWRVEFLQAVTAHRSLMAGLRQTKTVHITHGFCYISIETLILKLNLE